MERLTQRNPDGTYFYTECFERCAGLMDAAKCLKCEVDAKISARIGTMEDALEKKEQRPTNFDRIAASPEALANFLASLPCLEGPWDGAFQAAFCADCPAENCDAENCHHHAERNSPAWWLAQEATPDECGV